MSAIILGRRRDCDLALEHRYLRTFQSEHRTFKQWFCKPLKDPGKNACGDGSNDVSTWDYIPVFDRFGLLRISCALPLDFIKGCVIGTRTVLIEDWIYVPAALDEAAGLLIAACDQPLTSSMLAEDLMVETSLLQQRAQAASPRLEDLPYDVMCAILTLVAGRAISSNRDQLWSSLLRLFGIQIGLQAQPLPVRFGHSKDEAEIRGVLGVASWPITLFTVEAESKLFTPARLRLSNVDDDGETLFALTVTMRERGDLAEDLFLLATDGAYRLRKAD